jgi:hypothetical protein
VPLFRRAKKPPLIASAVMLSRTRTAGIVPAQQQWQTAAWGYYDNCGEYRQGVRWLANACSRAVLRIARIDPSGDADPEPVDDPKLTPFITEWAGGPQGQSQLLARMTTHLTVPGEAYLISYDDPETGQEVWQSVTSFEITGFGSDTLQLRVDVGKQIPLDPENSFVARVWRPHPMRAWLADSPSRPLLDDLKILCGLQSHTVATIDSRLAGNGILCIPQEAFLNAPDPSADDADLAATNDPFMDTLTRSMVTSIRDRDKASAVVPILLRAPGETIGNIQHIDLSSSFDERTDQLLTTAQRKLAIGMDIPPEILLGVGDVNHWTAWAVSEDSVKLHIEPVLELICTALTDRYLHPALKQAGIDPTNLVVDADTRELTLRPTRAEDAFQLYDRGELSAEALLREAGFGDTDKPELDEKKTRLLWKLAEQPALAPQVLPMLGINSSAEIPTQNSSPAAEEEGDQTQRRRAEVTRLDERRRALPGRPAVGEQTHPSDERPTMRSAALLAAADMAVLRALEVAGRRMLTYGHSGVKALRAQGVSEWQVHTKIAHDKAGCDLGRLLDGAWVHLSRSNLASPAAVAAVDRYTRHLLTSRTEHRTQDLARALDEAGVT